MTGSGLSRVVDRLRRSASRDGGAEMSDGQLLGRFLDERDQAALASLVRRHGPMVWGVCRRVLRRRHDAEDAFQATFLGLVRKAASVGPREMVGNWLYGVAYQTALKARAVAARRQQRERQVTPMPEPVASESRQEFGDELQRLLDDTLTQLPDKYRVLIVLCDLEGKTRKEVARQLRIPEGTVGGRLARARALLAKRLARHGLAVSGGMLATVLSQSGASAAAPAALLSSTIKIASLFAVGQVAAGTISPTIAGLMEGVVKNMFLTKLKFVTAIVVILS